MLNGCCPLTQCMRSNITMTGLFPCVVDANKQAADIESEINGKIDSLTGTVKNFVSMIMCFKTYFLEKANLWKSRPRRDGKRKKKLPFIMSCK